MVYQFHFSGKKNNPQEIQQFVLVKESKKISEV
jgi:hypothetical protein